MTLHQAFLLLPILLLACVAGFLAIVGFVMETSPRAHAHSPVFEQPVESLSSPASLLPSSTVSFPEESPESFLGPPAPPEETSMSSAPDPLASPDDAGMETNTYVIRSQPDESGVTTTTRIVITKDFMADPIRVQIRPTTPTLQVTGAPSPAMASQPTPPAEIPLRALTPSVPERIQLTLVSPHLQDPLVVPAVRPDLPPMTLSPLDPMPPETLNLLPTVGDSASPGVASALTTPLALQDQWRVLQKPFYLVTTADGVQHLIAFYKDYYPSPQPGESALTMPSPDSRRTPWGDRLVPGDLPQTWRIERASGKAYRLSHIQSVQMVY